LATVRVRPSVFPLAEYGATGTETTIGSDYPPLAQLTEEGMVTAVTPVVTVTNTEGKFM
jgi:hypothetical protein